jgi:hypothetical protein
MQNVKDDRRGIEWDWVYPCTYRRMRGLLRIGVGPINTELSCE